MDDYEACEYELSSVLFHKTLMPNAIFNHLNVHMMPQGYNRQWLQSCRGSWTLGFKGNCSMRGSQDPAQSLPYYLALLAQRELLTA